MRELFLEFLALSWSGHGERMRGLEDIVLGDYIIARLLDSGIIVIWLANGNRIKIPWEWVDLFTSFNVIYGERVLWKKDIAKYDNVEKIIYKMTLLVNQINWGRKAEFLENLADICSLGTKDFIEFFRVESGETLRPLEFRTASNTIKL